MSAASLLSKEQIERITERILMEYGFDPYGKQVRAVPIEEMIEFHFDLQLCWEVIDHLDREGLVMAAILPESKQIILNETHRELFESKLGTYCFTIAHELGHYVLHSGQEAFVPDLLLRRDGNKLAREPYYCRSSARKPIEEVEADYFAGCILMPRPMLELAVKQLTCLGGVRLSRLYQLAACLQVSISALTVRLEQLQLLTIDKEGNVFRPGEAPQETEQLSLQF